MSVILGVGTIALDTVETPLGSVVDAPGGSAMYFAAAASHLGPVSIVGVTGDDFPQAALDALAARGVDVSGVVRVADPTFRWQARYDETGAREILSVHRGGIVRRSPVVPPALRDPCVLFLGSTDPSVQRRVLDDSGAPGLVVVDTMGHWIAHSRSALCAVLARVDVLLVSEDEVRALGGLTEEAACASAVAALGPRWVVVKRGARGACAYGGGHRIETDAVPVARAVDPTGAGDAFAGGLVASLGRGVGVSETSMREALAVGVTMGARAVQAFSFSGLLRV